MASETSDSRSNSIAKESRTRGEERGYREFTYNGLGWCVSHLIVVRIATEQTVVEEGR